MAADTNTTARRRWQAMGSDAEIIVVAPESIDAEVLVQRAIERVEQLEALWSRFRPTSEVSRLNEFAGCPVEVSADTITLVTLAVEAWRITGGAFDPLLLDALVALGYDRTIDELRSQTAVAGPRGRAAHPAGRSLLSLVGCTDIEVSGRTVTLPHDCSFDGGGIGKGLASDLVLDELLRAGASGACVNLGGDLRVAGVSPDGPTWTLGIEFPGTADPIALVGLAGGAVATSTTLLRRWVADGEQMHHLLDPQTGRPSDSDVVFSTVIAAEAWEAEVLAKAVLLRGSERAFDLLIPGRHAALTVDRLGAIRVSEGFEHFVNQPLPNVVPIPTRSN